MNIFDLCEVNVSYYEQNYISVIFSYFAEIGCRRRRSRENRRRHESREKSDSEQSSWSDGELVKFFIHWNITIVDVEMFLNNVDVSYPFYYSRSCWKEIARKAMSTWKRRQIEIQKRFQF